MFDHKFGNKNLIQWNEICGHLDEYYMNYEA